jgi:hypothetical protein
MGEAQNRNGQNGTSLKEFADAHGYMPATVVGHKRQSNGYTLVTLDNDPDTNIEVYDDDRQPHRSGNPPTDS